MDIHFRYYLIICRGIFYWSTLTYFWLSNIGITHGCSGESSGSVVECLTRDRGAAQRHCVVFLADRYC